MTAIFYEFTLWILALIAFPKMLYMLVSKGKYRDSFLKRFGKGFPDIQKGTRPLIWIHSVSVGETKAVAALAKMLKAREDHPIILISTITETGQAEAHRSIPEADYHVYLPFDFRAVVAPIVHRVKPDLVVLSETDFWYNFLSAAKGSGARIALVNGKLSEKSLKRFEMMPFLCAHLFRLVDLFCLQSVHYRARFEQLGIPSNKIIVTGNVKFDEHYPSMNPTETESWKQSLGIAPGDRVLVVGSTHDSEEKLVLDALKPLWQAFPRLKVLLVPRHPERFPVVAALLAKEGYSFAKMSDNKPAVADSRVILVDAMGVLRNCYQIADLAIVAGSFTDNVGGHNIMEPSWYGVPVLFGPFMYSQPELVDLMLHYKAGLQVEPEKLSDVMARLLTHENERKILGGNGMRLISDMKGATRKTFEAL